LPNFKQLHLHELTDFASTAALIQEMDLVISVCTSVAHLSGALGKKTWVMLPHTADYRWLLEREDSPWYPTVKLFRQNRIGDWVEQLEKISNLVSARL
jgi:ADP-heptose:LPS heptosyltransferase